LLAFACTAWCSNGALFLRAASEVEYESEELSAEMTASLMQVEAEDRSFLLSQLDQTERQLVELQQLAEPVKASADKKVDAKAVEKTVAKVSEKPAAKATAAAGAKKENAKKEDEEVEAVKLLKLKGKAALAPMLAMMKGLYQDSKDRIAQQNTREEKSKKWFAEKEAEHKAKLASIEGKFKNGTLSEEFRTNETRDETRYFTYWSRCRERQHRQFHTNLKIQHAMMMKTKKMIDMYDKALSTKPSDQAQAKKELAQATGNAMPEIVFLQDTVSSFCRESLDEVQKERVELQEWDHQGLA